MPVKVKKVIHKSRIAPKVTMVNKNKDYIPNYSHNNPQKEADSDYMDISITTGFNGLFEPKKEIMIGKSINSFYHSDVEEIMFGVNLVAESKEAKGHAPITE